MPLVLEIKRYENNYFSEALRTLRHVRYLTFAFHWPKYTGSDAVDWALTPPAKEHKNTHVVKPVQFECQPQ